MRDLKIFHSPDSISFTDATLDLNNYLKDDVSVTFDGPGGIYVGLHKPFFKLYVELQTATTPDIPFNFDLVDPTSNITANAIDESRSGKRSGFITWPRNEAWQKATINGTELYWFRIFPAQTCTVVLRGLNLVFSNNEDMEKESALISDKYKRSTQNSFIQYHVAARDEILQKYRNSGKVIANQDGSVYDINQWDINRPEQLREASKFLALSKLFFDISSEIDDKYYQKYTDYLSEFQKAFDLWLLSIDYNDDGKEDSQEARKSRSVELLFR